MTKENKYFDEKTTALENSIINSENATAELFHMKQIALVKAGSENKVSEEYLLQCCASGAWRSKLLKSGEKKPLGLAKCLNDASHKVRGKAIVLNRLRVYETEICAYKLPVVVAEDDDETEGTEKNEELTVEVVTENFTTVLDTIKEIAEKAIAGKATKAVLIETLEEIVQVAMNE
jgi:hypothetical protein